MTAGARSGWARHGRGRRNRGWGGRGRGEEGSVIVILAVALPVLIVFAALSVDVGGWYARGLHLQRTADAAALAGVVWMPDYQQARTVALAEAAQNRVTPSSTITVNVSQDGNNLQRLTVAITDTDAPRYFSGVFRGRQTLTRTATAEFVVKVPLGSPKNTFGTGDLNPGTAQDENFWAAVNGYCAGHESGDLVMARNESLTVATGPAVQCNNGSAQTADYDPDGYLYAIRVPSAQPSLKLEVYDAGYDNTGSSPDLNLTPTFAPENQAVSTVYEVYDRDDTPLDTGDNPLLSTTTVTAANNATFKNTWFRLRTWTSPAAGTYYLRVKTSVQTGESRASNGFGLRAFTGSTFTLCTTIAGDTGYSANCPQVHGVTDMSIYASLGGAAGSTATFYLSQVDAVHAGKTMRIQLFDSGEGASRIEVLTPAGAPATFDWTTLCNPPTPPSGSVCGATGVTSLDVSGTGPQPYSGLVGSSKYNDRKITLSIKLPAGYPAAYGGKVWWQIRYTVGSTATDRTTWSVNIVGDPVHLVG